MEFWKTIKGSDGYEVSSMGNVRNVKTGRLLRPRPNKRNGYGRVALNGKDFYVHRLVADTFISGDHDGLQVNHLDGNKWNNALSNLEWCSRKDNMGHAVENDFHHRQLRRVVTCKDCCFRYDFSICEDKTDDFFCAYAKRTTGQF